jgi:hypothetical protein
MPGTATLTRAERTLLLGLQKQAIQYFLDNQTPDGLVLDRQRNHGPHRHQLRSTSATGMGLIALALASAPPFRLLTTAEAVTRVRTALTTARDRLPRDHGILPHFLAVHANQAYGADSFSTVDSAWLLAGGLWAATFLRDRDLEELAGGLYDDVDWRYWSVPTGVDSRPLLRHGRGSNGCFLPCVWDRLNGETVFLYVLAAGAAACPLDARSWHALGLFYGTLAGRRFNNADLGLFVFQYGLDLLDLGKWHAPRGEDLCTEAALAAAANHDVCRLRADEFVTYRRFWGLSAGDGPAAPPNELAYRCYAPLGPVDGTAHLTATLASVQAQPALVLENIREALAERQLSLRGRYGLSNVNVDHAWVGPDMVGIDAGAAVLALDNVLQGNRVRSVFHEIPCVTRGLERLGFRRTLRRAA